MYVRVFDAGVPRASSPMRCSVSCMKIAGLLLGTICPSAIMARFLTAMRGLVRCGRRLVRIDWWKLTRVLLSLQR